MTEFQVSVPPIFSFRECQWFLDRNYDDIMHQITETSVIKPFRVAEKLVLVEISQRENALSVVLRAGDVVDETILREEVIALFDLSTDLAPFYQQLMADPDLAFMVTEYYGLRLIGIPDLFEALCWSIIGQQINLRFAYTLKRRLVELTGEKISYHDVAFYGFPRPERLAALDVQQLRNLQFSGRKAEYLIGLARSFVEGDMSRAYLRSLPTPEDQVQALTTLRGIGEWTAHYALMKSLRVPTSIPYGDVGLYNALHGTKGLPKRPTRPELATVFGSFKGWEAYLTLYLWRSLAPR